MQDACKFSRQAPFFKVTQQQLKDNEENILIQLRFLWNAWSVWTRVGNKTHCYFTVLPWAGPGGFFSLSKKKKKNSSGICKLKLDSQLPDSWQSHMHPVMVKACNNWFWWVWNKNWFQKGGEAGRQFGGWGQGGEGGGLIATALQVGLTGAKCTPPDQENKNNKVQNKSKKKHTKTTARTDPLIIQCD